MKKYFFLLLALAFSNSLFSQNRTYHIKFGTAHFAPKFVLEDTNAVYRSIPSFQASINKDYPLNRFLDFTIGLGLNRNEFETKDRGGLEQKIWFNNLSLEPGFMLRQEVGTVSFFTQLGVRLSLTMAENYTQFLYMNRPSSDDYGVNLSVGARWEGIPLRPYLILGYYRGMINLFKGQIVGNMQGESFSNVLRNRSIGVQMGIYVW